MPVLCTSPRASHVYSLLVLIFKISMNGIRDISEVSKSQIDFAMVNRVCIWSQPLWILPEFSWNVLELEVVIEIYTMLMQEGGVEGML